MATAALLGFAPELWQYGSIIELTREVIAMPRLGPALSMGIFGLCLCLPALADQPRERKPAGGAAGAIPTEDRSKPEDLELARRYYKLGEQLYNTSSFPEALAEFLKAYQLAPRPDLLFNIARCYEVMAQLEKAIDAYSRYLRDKPDTPDADLIRARIANLRRQLAARQEAERRQPGVPTTLEAKSAPPMLPPPGPPRRRWPRIAGWAAVGVGAACLATGIAFGILARQKADEFQSGSGALLYHQLDDIDRQGQQDNTIALATLVVGGVAAAGGAGLLLWDWAGTRRERSTAALVPFIARGSVGLAGAIEF